MFFPSLLNVVSDDTKKTKIIPTRSQIILAINGDTCKHIPK
jgi:hypothetical protein